MVIGDFNAYLQASEKKSARQPQFAQIEAFREALNSCHLQDLGYIGYPYTWSNKRPGVANTKIRLDRGVANKEWTDRFQLSKLVNLSTHASDHLPILLHVQSFTQPKQQQGRSFKFEESWLLCTDCEEIVQEAWGKASEERTGLAAIQEKIKVCGAELLAWGSPITDSDTIAIKEIQKQLDRLNKAELTEEAKAEFLELSKKMDDLLQKQEIFWAQRFRLNWLKHGDRNTKFFHARATQRKRRNHIRGIWNTNG